MDLTSPQVAQSILRTRHNGHGLVIQNIFMCIEDIWTSDYALMRLHRWIPIIHL